MFNAQDVRPIIQAYAGKDIPIEYAKKEAESKQKAIEEWERKNPSTSLGGSSGFLSGIFGGVAAVSTTGCTDSAGKIRLDTRNIGVEADFPARESST